MRAQPQYAWLAAGSWLVLAGYLALTLYLVRRYHPKLISDGLVKQRAGEIGSAVYDLLTPVWANNRFIVPGLCALAALCTWLWHRSRRVGRAAA